MVTGEISYLRFLFSWWWGLVSVGGEILFEWEERLTLNARQTKFHVQRSNSQVLNAHQNKFHSQRSNSRPLITRKNQIHHQR